MQSVTDKTITTPRIGWLLYDGACGICRTGVSRWRMTLQHHGFAVAALQEPWVHQRLHLPMENLLDDLRVLTLDGQRYDGVDAYRLIMRHIWWLRPLGWLIGLPGMHQLAHLAYRRIVRKRHCISKWAGLDQAKGA